MHAGLHCEKKTIFGPLTLLFFHTSEGNSCGNICNDLNLAGKNLSIHILSLKAGLKQDPLK